MSLILASSSPWKLEILRAVGLEVAGEGHRVNEREVAFGELLSENAGESIEEGVRRIAEAKALSVSRRHDAAILVLGTDQVLEIDGKVFGKAGSPGEAHSVLSLLQGRGHRLVCGWALARQHHVTASGVDTAHLRMRSLTGEQIQRYVETDEWRGMAGCYRFESIGRQLFDSIEGDFFTILGMPLCSLLPTLRRVQVVSSTGDTEESSPISPISLIKGLI